MKTAKTAGFKTTFHRDTVTVWNVYTQTWMRCPAGQISDSVLASLLSPERERIVRMSREAKNEN